MLKPFIWPSNEMKLKVNYNNPLMKTSFIAAGALALALLFNQSDVTATGNPIKKTDAKALVKGTTLAVDPATSSLNWTAKKVGGSHNGNVKLSKGALNLNGNKLTGGSFMIDMTTITDVDITNEDFNKKLTGHLKSEDFFSVDKNPTSSFTISKVTPIAKAKAGEPNYTVTGNLTIKGITNPVTFPATVKVNGDNAEATAKIDIDRTKWDIKYRSGLIGTAADKIIDDIFTLDVKLVAGKSSTAKL
jgi:polyisoprenoid-binding protein YceI